MGKDISKTPILFLVFNRLDTTRRSFEAIRRIRPERLYIGADGAREDIAGEREKVEAVRGFLRKSIDWDCKVSTLFHVENLGCRNAPVTAIKWFFENEEEGIVLEDDCVPGSSFFRYCSELLIKYRDEPRVMCISGNVFHSSKMLRSHSYYFSRIPHTWGWASWRRAWKLYDPHIKSYPEFEKKNTIANFFKRKKEQRYWLDIFEKVYKGEYNTCWDYQWLFAILNNNGLACNPRYNLVENIGFGADATHTVGWSHQWSVKPLTFPLIHPEKIEGAINIDSYTMKVHFLPRSFPYRAIRKGFRILKKQRKILMSG